MEYTTTVAAAAISIDKKQNNGTSSRKEHNSQQNRNYVHELVSADNNACDFFFVNHSNIVSAFFPSAKRKTHLILSTSDKHTV